jgi:cell division protein FtsL
MKKDKIQEEQQDIELSLETGEEQGGEKESPAEEALKETIKKIKETASEEDPRPSQQVNLRTILGGDILTAEMVRSHIWLFILIVAFTIVYVAFRYQCQQDMQAIDRLETQLKDAKNKALAASSTLTEKCRESHVLEILRQNKDSLLHIADKPPYIISIPE